MGENLNLKPPAKRDNGLAGPWNTIQPGMEEIMAGFLDENQVRCVILIPWRSPELITRGVDKSWGSE